MGKNSNGFDFLLCTFIFWGGSNVERNEPHQGSLKTLVNQRDVYYAFKLNRFESGRQEEQMLEKYLH